MQGRDEIVRIPVGEQQIEVAIVVVVKKLQTPPAHEFGGFADTGGKCQVIKRLITIIFIYGEHFAVEVCHEQAHPSIIIKICRVHSHAGSRTARVTVSHAGSGGDLIESSLAAIDEKKIGHRVIAHP